MTGRPCDQTLSVAKISEVMAMVTDASNEHLCVQVILGKYLGECQAIKDAVTTARDAKAGAEDRYANARTQQQAEAAEADIKSSTEALAQVLSTLVAALTLGQHLLSQPLQQGSNRCSMHWNVARQQCQKGSQRIACSHSEHDLCCRQKLRWSQRHPSSPPRRISGTGRWPRPCTSR